MGERVTWRSRPRSDYPWPLRTKTTTVADLISDYGNNGIIGMIGPLPMAAMVELIYRVKAAEFVFSVETKYGEDAEDYPWTTTSRTGTMGFTGTPTEINALKEASYSPESFGFVSSLEMEWEGADPADVAYLSSVSSSPLAGHAADIFKDENGEFWVTGSTFFAVTEPGGGNAVDIEIRENDSYATFAVVSVSLVLSSGTFAFDQIASCDGYAIRNSELTIAASEWWPYKTTAGAAAWDTATGAAANGGPGA